MIKVMLSLDLINAEEKKRTDFYADLSGAGWKKAKNVDTVWLKDFEGCTSSEDDLKKIRDNIATLFINSYKKLKLEKIFYVAQIGNEIVISRVVEERSGKVKAYSEKVF